MMRNMLLAMDPPTHTVHRTPLLPHFRARVVAGIEDRVREICRAIMTKARERQEVEFVHEGASPLPTRVIGQLLACRPRTGTTSTSSPSVPRQVRTRISLAQKTLGLRPSR